IARPTALIALVSYGVLQLERAAGAIRSLLLSGTRSLVAGRTQAGRQRLSRVEFPFHRNRGARTRDPHGVAPRRFPRLCRHLERHQALARGWTRRRVHELRRRDVRPLGRADKRPADQLANQHAPRLAVTRGGSSPTVARE